jgi:uncharacterized protein involved in exopolysaccharide biosynthesis
MNEIKYPFLEYLIKNKKINIPIIIGATIIITLIIFFVIQLEYTSKVTILPTAANFSQGLTNQLGALGAIAGINIGSNSGQSQEMFIGILNSRRLLDKVSKNEYSYDENGETHKGNLIELFEVEGDSKREIEEQILKIMRENVFYMEIDPMNGILNLNVTTMNPFLSSSIANFSAFVLNEIVKTEVQKEFRQKLKYLNEKVSELEDGLKIAENDLKKFLETNTDPTTPEFQIEQLRLRRNLEIQTQLFIEFKKQLEIFIADNMVNLADIKILDTAYPPYRKSRPKRSLLLITFVGLFGFIQIGINGSIYIYKKLSKELSGKTK